jgi:bacillopeptidase F
LQEDGPIEVIILLGEQADTFRLARTARRNAPMGATAKEQRMQASLEIVRGLQQTAARSQAPLLEYLEGERKQGNITDLKSFHAVNALYIRAGGRVISKLSLRPEVDKILPNRRIRLESPEAGAAGTTGEGGVEWNIERIGAPAVWDDYGLDGAGVVIGVIDSGVQWDHEALMEKWRGYDPTGPDPTYSWFDAVSGAEMPLDLQGHGTHVTGIILGSDPAGDHGIGVAPGAQWIAARVPRITQLRLRLRADQCLRRCEQGACQESWRSRWQR